MEGSGGDGGRRGAARQRWMLQLALPMDPCEEAQPAPVKHCAGQTRSNRVNSKLAGPPGHRRHLLRDGGHLVRHHHHARHRPANGAQLPGCGECGADARVACERARRLSRACVRASAAAPPSPPEHLRSAAPRTLPPSSTQNTRTHDLPTRTLTRTHTHTHTHTQSPLHTRPAGARASPAEEGRVCVLHLARQDLVPHHHQPRPQRKQRRDVGRRRRQRVGRALRCGERRARARRRAGVGGWAAGRGRAGRRESGRPPGRRADGTNRAGRGRPGPE
jgi:hypothetical protein